MNDEAREVLVKAALEGRTQLRYALHDADGNACAIGELHNALHGIRRRSGTNFCVEWFLGVCEERLRERFGLTADEHDDIVHRNNGTGPYEGEPQDFLTIARKVGRDGDV